MRRAKVAVWPAVVSCVTLPCLGQVQIVGRVWMPRALEEAGLGPPETGLAVDYFSPAAPADPPEMVPLPNVRCFATPADARADSAGGESWEMAPRGWYRLSGSAGCYTLLFSNPAGFFRPRIFTNIYLQDGETIDLKVTPHSYYAVLDWTSHDPRPAAVYYQTFTARGTAVTGVGFKVAHDGVDGAGPGGQNLTVTIHRRGEGSPETWERIGPPGIIREVDSGGPKNRDWSVGWNSGEVPTVSGEIYAVCVRPEKADGRFQMWLVPQGKSGEECYRVGPDGSGAWTGRRLSLYVGGDGEGLLIPCNKRVHVSFGEFAGFARKWSQTYEARGRGLAGVILYAATSGVQPGIARQRVAVRVREGRPDGRQIGAERIAIGQGIFTGDASWGVFGVAFAPGDVPLTPGRGYAIEFESIENHASLHGYVNIKGMKSDERPGFNPYRRQAGDDYTAGTAYRHGTEDAGFDLDMQIIEYAGEACDWHAAVGEEELLINGGMEEGHIDPDLPENGRAEGWQTFTLAPNTLHQYLTDGPDHQNRILRITCGKSLEEVHGGYVQQVGGLRRLETYRITGRVRCSWAVDVDHVCWAGVDPTGQVEDPRAGTIRWTPLPATHSTFVDYTGPPVRPQRDAISIWLRAWARSAAGHPFRADFDDFSVRCIRRDVPPQASPQAARATGLDH